MKTRILGVDKEHIDYNKIKEACAILAEGGLVAFPTETVYGIGAHALDLEGASKIYKAKGRPSDNPLIIHIGSSEQAQEYAKDISEMAKKLMKQFWPGPLTLVFRKKSNVPYCITGGLDTVAIRVPAHPIAKAIMVESGLPIAAPSANVSGRPSPTTGDHVIHDLMGKVDMIIDGGACDIGLESTVLDMTGPVPTILRPGGVTPQMIQDVVGEVEYDPALVSVANNIVPKAPGMKYKHYAPDAELTVIEGDMEKVISYINEQARRKVAQGKRVGVIATTDTVKRYHASYVEVIGDENKPEEIASNLFKVLRNMDAKDMDVIYSQSFSNSHIGYATMNRLLKAAGNKILRMEE